MWMRNKTPRVSAWRQTSVFITGNCVLGTLETYTIYEPLSLVLSPFLSLSPPLLSSLFLSILYSLTVAYPPLPTLLPLGSHCGINIAHKPAALGAS